MVRQTVTAEELVERAAINDLLDDYALAIDSRDWELLDGLFTADAELDYTGSGVPAGTRDEVLGWIQKALGGVALTQHVLMNRRIRVSGETATARTELLNPLVLQADGAAQLMLLGGVYEDQLVKAADGWRISARIHRAAWTAGPLPAQLTSPAGA